MDTGAELEIPRLKFGLLMLGVTVLGLACAWIVAGLGSGSEAESRSAAMALAIGSFLTFIPAVARISRDYWGVAVLFCGAARILAVLGIAYLITNSDPSRPSRPIFMGAASGAGLVMIAESALAVVFLSQIERARERLKKAVPPAVERA